MYTLTYVNVEYETSISSWDIWNDVRTKMIVLNLFHLTTWLHSQNPYETKIHNELWHINLYMNIGISNWYIWSIDPTKMRFLTSFHFDTRLLNSKHKKLFSTYLVEWNGAMLKTCFSAPQIAIKEHQLKHKIKVLKWSLK
jgi:hypothetical protein